MPYMSGLFAISLLCLVTAWRKATQREQILRTVLVIFLNWCAGLAYIQNSGDMTPWQFNIFIDSAAAAIILWHPAGRVQAYVGLFYMIQIAFHTAYGIREVFGQSVDQIFYYDAITFIAWGQLLALGAWCGGIWGKDAVRGLRDHGHALDRRKGNSHNGVAS